jgi:hypothetical protein
MPTDIPSSRKSTGSEWILSVQPYAWWLVGVFAVISLTLRFAPLPENFASFGALAFFCGLFLSGPARWVAPAIVLFTADTLGHFLRVPGMGFYYWPAMVLNYLGFGLMASVGACLGQWWHRSSARLATSLASLPLGAAAGSGVFFLVSNFGAWLDPQMGYEKTLSGLVQCYEMGLPFWRSTLSSDFCFGVGFPVAAWFVASALTRRSHRAVT